MTRWPAIPLAMLLAACVAEPDVGRLYPAQALEARRVLASAVAAGPVRIDLIDAPGAFTTERLVALAAEGVPALQVRFATDAPPVPRLVMSFHGSDPQLLCDGIPTGDGDAPSPARLSAAFCDARGVVAAVSGEAAGPNLKDTERLIWRTTARLFPDDYEDTYGFNLFGSRFRLGLGGSWGF